MLESFPRPGLTFCQWIIWRLEHTLVCFQRPLFLCLLCKFLPSILHCICFCRFVCWSFCFLLATFSLSFSFLLFFWRQFGSGRGRSLCRRCQPILYASFYSILERFERCRSDNFRSVVAFVQDCILWIRSRSTHGNNSSRIPPSIPLYDRGMMEGFSEFSFFATRGHTTLTAYFAWHSSPAEKRFNSVTNFGLRSWVSVAGIGAATIVFLMLVPVLDDSPVSSNCLVSEMRFSNSICKLRSSSLSLSVARAPITCASCCSYDLSLCQSSWGPRISIILYSSVLSSTPVLLTLMHPCHLTSLLYFTAQEIGWLTSNR